MSARPNHSDARFGIAAWWPARSWLAATRHVEDVDCSVGVLDGDELGGAVLVRQSQNDLHLASSADVVGQVTGTSPARAASSAGVVEALQHLPVRQLRRRVRRRPDHRGPRADRQTAPVVGVIKLTDRRDHGWAGAGLAGGRAVIVGVDAEFIWNVTDPSANRATIPTATRRTTPWWLPASTPRPGWSTSTTAATPTSAARSGCRSAYSRRPGRYGWKPRRAGPSRTSWW